MHVDEESRHDTEVFKALALRANFVRVGRSALWSLSYKDQAGGRVHVEYH